MGAASTVGASQLLHQVLGRHDPGQIAVRSCAGAVSEVTYGGLEQRSDQLAHALVEAGVTPGQIVALLLPPGPDLLTAQLAVMKAGAAWMPLDPEHPPARLAFQIGDAAAALALSTVALAKLGRESAPGVSWWSLDEPALRARLAGYPSTPPDVEVRPDDAAYLIYTSGSTGAPKGVLVSHRSAYQYCRNAVEQLGITSADRIPQVANPAFDVTVFDCYATLLAGATLVSAPRRVITDPAAFTDLLCEEGITLAYIPPAILALLDPQRLTGSRLRGLFSAGATLSTQLLNRWSRPGLEIHNSYGPTETTVACTNYRCPGTPLDGPVPIGTAMPEHRAYVLDKRLRPAPIGVPGQLYIAGAGVAHGYLNRPGLTAQRFLPDPFAGPSAGQPGQRMYATGDLARWRSDGELEFLGRTDRQVKLRGQRIELGEIEHVLASHPAIRDCAVLLHQDSHLVAYLVAQGDLGHSDLGQSEIDTAELIEHLANRLPAYMVPTAFTVLPELPLTLNGKLDTARLTGLAPRDHGHTPPQTDTERWLAATWQDLLGVEQVGASDNFFDLGANSLHGTQLIARIRDHLRIELQPRHLFTTPVLEQLAAKLDESEPAVADPQSITPVARDGALPCTHQQQGLWFLHRLDPMSSVYHLAFALRLRGELDVAALERALHELVVRHEALRTRFVEQDGLPRQLIDPPPQALSLPAEPVQAGDVTGWVAEHFGRPFELTAGSLFRVALARTAPGEHVLALVIHHIVADGWSLRILANELSLLYAAETDGGDIELAPLGVQPADHAAWQRDRLDGAELERQVSYWRQALAGLPTVDFPADRPRPAHPTGAGAVTTRALPDELATAARDYARDNQVSFLAVLQAALLTVLHRYTGQEDLVIGSVFSGRTRPEIEPVVGYFANTLVLRTDLSGEPTFAELVQRCHDTVMNAAAHQDVPFALIVDEVQPERVTGRNPLFQISLTLQPAGTQADLALGGLAAEPVTMANGYARFDLAFDVIDAPDALEMSLEYSTELFDADRIERLLDHYRTALADGLAQPDTVPDSIMSGAERHQVLHAWNPAPTYPVPGLLHRVVAGHDPGRVAIRFRGPTSGELTYGELEQRSNQLAHALVEAGVGPGQIVALLLHPGLELPIAQLAVMKAGAAWMPLDPQHPPARLAFQIADAGVPLLLITSDLADEARESAPDVPTWSLDEPALRIRLAGYPGAPPETRIGSEDAAYLLYTSGSTGAPKGVLVSHRSAYQYCRNAVELLGVTAADRIPQVANPAFDVSVFDCFAALLAGATLISAPRRTITDPAALTHLLCEEGVTLAYIPPTILALLDPRRLLDSRLRGLFSAGSAPSAELLNRWSRPGLEIHNSYGPTEATVICLDYRCPGTPLDGPVPIGTALPEHRAYVLDGWLRPVPVGVPGQLYIAGAGVAHGYLNRPGLTAQRFLPDLYGDPGQRMYASGDLARWRSDGVVEYLGRTDRQVKLRGQRIELGEIEHVLASHPAIRDCAVLLHQDSQLVAYLVTDPDHDEPAAAELTEHLASRLPAYMIPTTYTVLPELPVTPNGKLDTARLPQPQPDIAQYTEPRTDTERWLAATWQDLLEVDRVGAGDDFFALGGNSLHGTQLIARIRDHLNIELHPRHLFTTPVLEQLAAKLDHTQPTAPDQAITPVARDGALPCTHQQQGLWFLHRLDPSSSVYHLAFALRLSGELDVAALQRALHQLVIRHEALRTRFIEQDGLPRQVIDPPPATHPLPVRPLLPEQAPSWVAAQIRQPFDLTAGSLFRTALARLAPDEHVLALVIHHIVADGWSLRILGDELSLLYAAETDGGDIELAPLPVQPADHAAWQRDRLDGAELERQISHWRQALAGLPTVDFPADRPRPPQPTGAGATLARRVPNELATAARDYARHNQVSFLAVLKAALLTVLQRYTGQEDLVIGSVFSGRTRPEIEPVVGFFANTLVLRTDVSGEPSFAELVHRCHDTVMTAAAHQDVPFALIVDALQPERVAGRNPLFQISLTLQPAGTQADLALGAVSATPLELLGSSARFDIALDAIEAPGGLELSLEYSTELFDADRIERLFDHYLTALANGLARPSTAADDIDIVGSSTEHRPIAHTPKPASAAPVPGLLHQVADGHDRQRVAIRFRDGRGSGELTYGQLEQRSNQLAHALVEAGVRPGQIVAQLLRPGFELLIARLGVMKAGAAWLPLDPEHPPARLAFQITDTAPVVLLATHDLAELAAEVAPGAPLWILDEPDLAARVAAYPASPPLVEVRPDDAAYLIYTSGSTGVPKGVLVSHRSAYQYCRNVVEQLGITDADRIPQVANPAFDASVFDCFATLLAGATLISAPRRVVTHPEAFTTLLCEEEATFSFVTPAFLRLLTPQEFTGSRLRGLLAGGETFDGDLLNRWSRPGLEIHNSYGPTETTVACVNYRCPATPLDGPAPIGTAAPEHRAYVLDGKLRQVPIGVPGQLYIAGAGVAHGYLNRPGLTAERFLPDPFADQAGQPGQRMYATGDLARWRSDGELEFLGRTDRQVKLRGQRIELGEIEHVLASHPTVRHCAVLLHQDSHLIAYISGNASGNTPDPAELREHLASRLPAYMIPTAFAVLPELPLSPNGKLDTARLPDLAPGTVRHVAPRTDTERWLAHAWQDLLGVEQVGAEDNFFDLGGNSLHGTQLIARIHDHLHLELQPRQLLTNPTLRQLAARLDISGPDDTAHADEVIALRPEGTQPPLFFVHPVGGSVAHYVRLAPLLGDDQPFYAIEDPGLRGVPGAADLTERAGRYIEALRRARPVGPYRLGGWSLGGLIALEMARQLTSAGERVAIVIALDTGLVADQRIPDDVEVLSGFVRDLAGIAGASLPDVDPATLWAPDRDTLEDRVLTAIEDAGLAPPGIREELRTRIRVFAANVEAAMAHRPRRYGGRVALISASGNDAVDVAAWQALSPDFEHRSVPGDHYSMLLPPHVDALAAALRDCLEAAS